MKRLRAYTLLEVLVVMSIMIILLGLAFSSYASFTEATKFNQDVANLQSDIVILQRAAMLLERDPDEYWIYGLGIDFSGVENGNGEYTFFKWCSEFTDFGDEKTKGEYPYYIDSEDPFDGQIPLNISGTTCDIAKADELANLTKYGKGNLNLKERVSINSDIQFLLFESVSGRAFLYTNEGMRVDPTVNLEINFEKNFGQEKTLTVQNRTGRTKITEYIH